MKKVLDGRWFWGSCSGFFLWYCFGVVFEDRNHKSITQSCVFNSKMKSEFDVDYGSTEFVASIIAFDSVRIKNRANSVSLTKNVL